MKVQRLTADGKLGYLFPAMRYRSIGLQLKWTDYRSTGFLA